MIFSHKQPPENNFRRQLFDDLDYIEKRIVQIQDCFDMTSEPELVESLIYEELALKARYAYLLRIAKQQGISCRISIGG